MLHQELARPDFTRKYEYLKVIQLCPAEKEGRR